MASNISVAITVDNKQYIANINAADNATKKFATDTERNLGKVNTSFDTFTRRVGGLRTALAGLAFGAVGRSALQLADSLQDLSNSSGIAVGTLLDLQKALVTSGGEADALPQAINTLLRSIDEAAGGSIKAQNAFMKLGITLTELGTLSEKDLMIETLKGIAALPTATERATAMMQNFGKSFKTVSPQELLDKLTATSGASDKYAASIKRAAELNDQLATAQGNLKLAFLEAFSGPIQKLVEFSNATSESSAKMETLITVVKALGIALATAFAISGALGLITIIGQIGRAFTVVTGLSKGMGGIFRAGGSLMVGLRGVAVLVATLGTSIFAASQLFDNFGDIAYNALLRVAEAVVSLAGSLGGAGLGAALGSLLGPIGTLVGGLAGGFAGDALGKALGADELVAKMKKAREETERIAQLDKLNKNRKATAGEGVAVATGNGVVGGGLDTPSKGPIREVDTTARAQAIAGIKEMTAEYEKQQRLNLARIDIETRFIGLGEESKAIAEAQVSLAQQYSNQQDELIKKRQSLGKDEQYLAATINEQIKKNAQAFNAQFAAITQSVTAQQAAKKAEEDRLYFIDLQTKSMNTILDIQANIASFSMSEDERKIAALQRQIKLEEDAAVKREQSRLGATPITAEAEAAIREKVRKSTEGQLKAQQELNAATKEANALLFVQDLQNTAISNAITLQGELAKLTMTSDQQRIQDLRTQNELLVAQEVAKRKALLKRGEDLPASEIAKIRDEVTSANKGFINSTQATIEKSREFNTGWEQSFNKYKEDANNSASQAKTYFDTFSKGAEDAMVRFVQTGKLSFKDLANSLIADFIRIETRKAMSGLFGGSGGILGALGSFFGMGGITGGGGGGAMANGGQAQGNTPYLIGERGPELFVPQNAGKIVPNHALGGGSNVVNNTTEVTYSIQAVDASSFRSMLARDPEFIHNVAEQGRRQLPIRSRR